MGETLLIVCKIYSLYLMIYIVVIIIIVIRSCLILVAHQNLGITLE